MQQGDVAIYSIGAVERMLDIPAATIRNWEERYGLVKPERSNGGHRLYTRGQVEHLRFVKEGLDRGLQPAEAHRLLMAGKYSAALSEYRHLRGLIAKALSPKISVFDGTRINWTKIGIADVTEALLVRSTQMLNRTPSLSIVSYALSSASARRTLR